MAPTLGVGVDSLWDKSLVAFSRAPKKFRGKERAPPTALLYALTFLKYKAKTSRGELQFR